MTRIDVWMPMYWGDYFKSTLSLSNAEHGAYLKTIGAYWTNGESLLDGEFRVICGKEFLRVSQFYCLEGGRWHHKRIDEELAKARERVKIAHEKAMKMVEARRRAGQLPPKDSP